MRGGAFAGACGCGGGCAATILALILRSLVPQGPSVSKDGRKTSSTEKDVVYARQGHVWKNVI
jgi:hypothetical protein